MSWCIHRKYRFEVRNEHTSNIAERIRCPTVGVLGHGPKSLGRFNKDGNTDLVYAVFESMRRPMLQFVYRISYIRSLLQFFPQ